MKSFPFDSQITGTDSETGLPLMDRAQSAETLQKFFENLFQDGIFQNYENCCQVSPGSGMNVLVNVGGGCCGGSIFVEENIRTLALQAAHENLDRIDAIIVRKNNNINYRSTDLYVVTGNPAEIPVAPEPTRSSSIHEIVLAHVFVARGTTSIPSYRITDTRLDSSVCGIATPMQEVDTSGIFEQYQAALDEYLETVASAIDNTLAGNLQNQITALSNNQADAFSKTSTYSVGDYCIYQNVLKKCIKDVETAGDYDSTCWEDTTIGEEFSELNRNLRVYTFSKSATVSYSGNNTMSVKCYRQGNIVTTYISYTGTLPKGIIGLSPSGVSGITIPEGFRPNNEAYGSYVGVAGTSVYEADNGRYRISTDGTIYHGCTDESYHERNVTITYHTDDPIPN